MKRNYLSKLIFLLLILSNLTLLNAVEIQKSNINTNAYVILLGTYAGLNDARRFANTFEFENIYILEDNNIFTVRIVNIETKQLAIKKLRIIREKVPDALLWKKMIFLQKERYDKFHSKIYTIESKDEIKTDAEG